MAQLGRALDWGSRGRAFESHHSDFGFSLVNNMFAGLFYSLNNIKHLMNQMINIEMGLNMCISASNPAIKKTSRICSIRSVLLPPPTPKIWNWYGVEFRAARRLML